jgi:hypothetical protein
MKKIQRLFLTSDAHDRNMTVTAVPATPTTLQEVGYWSMYGIMHGYHAVLDPGGSLEPTTVGGEAAVRTSFTTSKSPDMPSEAHNQQYTVLHGGLAYLIAFSSKPDSYASATADFDSIVHSWKWSTPPSDTSQPSTPAEVALEKLLFSPDQMNSTMGTTGMRAGKATPGTHDAGATVPDTACLAIQGPADPKVYEGSGWTTMSGQKDFDLETSVTVDQDVVLFPSAHEADAFFTASAQRWQACSNRQYTLTVAGLPDRAVSVGSVSNTNGTLSAIRTAQSANGLTCQRALTVADDVAIDISVCHTNGADSKPDAAVDIAHQIAAKVPTR